MSHLIGKTLLGNNFIQDGRSSWVKINNIVLGESPKFGYNYTQTTDIGQLLDNSINDNQIAVINYEWDTGNAFIKTGFDLNDPSDYKVNNKYTSFILASYNPNNTPNNTPNVPSDYTNDNSGGFSDLSKCKCKYKCPHDFVKISNGNLIYQNKELILVGPNVYWLGYTEEGWYPTKYQIVEMFEVAKKTSSTVIRSHTLGHSSGRINSLRPWNNNLNDKAWDTIDFSFYMAETYNIKLICPLTDCYLWYNGNYGDFCKTRNVPKRDFWTNIDVRNDFKDYIFKWLNHRNPYNGLLIKDNPVIALIEIGNELGNIRPDHDSTTIPTFEWINDITNYIKSIDKNHLVLCPSDECLGQANEFNIKNLDCFSGHFYWNEWHRMDYGIREANKLNKPYIIGEYSSKFDDNWFREIEKKNIKGSIYWSLYCHRNGIYGGGKVEHTDGFTVHYPEDKGALLRITNHFRRLRKLPPVNDI